MGDESGDGERGGDIMYMGTEGGYERDAFLARAAFSLASLCTTLCEKVLGCKATWLRLLAWGSEESEEDSEGRATIWGLGWATCVGLRVAIAVK